MLACIVSANMATGGEFFDEVFFSGARNTRYLPVRGNEPLINKTTGRSFNADEWQGLAAVIAHYLHHVPGAGAVSVAYLDL